MKNKNLVEITQEEHSKLNIYKKHCSAVMKFLAIKHHRIYMDIISNMLGEVEKDVRELIDERSLLTGSQEVKHGN